MRDIDNELNLEQVARRLGVSAKTVRRRIDQGKISAHVDPLNDRLFVEKSEVDRILGTKTPYVPKLDKDGLSDTSVNMPR